MTQIKTVLGGRICVFFMFGSMSVHTLKCLFLCS